MNGDYLALAARIRQDLDEVRRVADRAQVIWADASRTGDDYHVDATALNLHGVYAGLERIFEAIAVTADQSQPGGASWHLELLRQMSVTIPDVRPAVLTVATRDQLDRYRGFRHVVRNVYTFNLDPVQIGLLMDGLPRVLDAVGAELLAFAAILQSAGHE